MSEIETDAKRVIERDRERWGERERGTERGRVRQTEQEEERKGKKERDVINICKDDKIHGHSHRSTNIVKEHRCPQSKHHHYRCLFFFFTCRPIHLRLIYGTKNPESKSPGTTHKVYACPLEKLHNAAFVRRRK